MVVNFVEPTTVSAIVPILIVPLAAAEVVIDVILLNFAEPLAVLEAEAPLICSVIVVPLELIPVTVNVFLLSSAEQKMVTTAFKFSLGGIKIPFSVIVPAAPGLAKVNKLSSSIFVAPLICSVIVVPLESVPVTVNVFALSSAEQEMVTTAFKSLASFKEPFNVIVPAVKVLFKNKLSSSFTNNL